MKKNSLHSALLLFVAICLASGCHKKDDDEPANITPPEKDDGVYVINEGTFGGGNGSIDYYSAKADSIQNDIYGYVNALPLGDVVQSMTIFNGKGYICVNNSHKVEVVNMADFVSTGTSNGYAGPRYFLGINNTRGYVSDWFTNGVMVVDLVTNAVIDTIPTGAGPEQMVMVNNNVYVTNVGGYGNDSTVTVINTITSSVIATIQVRLNPNSIKTDASGKIWVLCGGSIGPDFTPSTADDRAGSLVRINPATNSVEQTLAMTAFDHPVKLAIDGNGTNLYYLNGVDGYKGRIFTMNVNSNVLPAVPLVNKDFYGLGVGPQSGELYGGFAPDFLQSGTLFRYKNDGSLISSKTTGVAPNGIVFY
jgi:YVTN family beta-propeller protein